MQEHNRVASAIQRAWPSCAGLPLVIMLAACGVAGPASQPQTASQSPTTAPAPTAESTTLPILGPPTVRPSPSPSEMPLTAKPLPVSTAVAADQAAITAATAPDATTSAPATPSASPLPAPASGAWQTYRSERAGFSVEYPADWTVGEQTKPDGSVVTTFSAASGGLMIVVAMMPGQVASENDLPNTRCQQVTIGGLPGTRCLDTISRSTAITLVGQGKTFTIAAVAKRLDPQTFDRFLDHFAPIAGP